MEINVENIKLKENFEQVCVWPSNDDEKNELLKLYTGKTNG